MTSKRPQLRQLAAMVAACAVLAGGAVMASSSPFAAEADASTAAADPLGSPVWADIVKKHFAGSAITFDPRVKVIAPTVIENQAQVPITADARGVPNVVKLIVVADLNPIQHVLTLTPAASKAEAFVAFRMKLEQASPVRAAALTSDGVWHVGGVFVEAAGGGCSSPAMARGDASWWDTLGQAQGRIWRQANGTARLRMRVRHPMDTGLAKDNTPAFFIEKFDIKSDAGDSLATLEMFEPMGEDPTVTMEVKLPPADASLAIEGRDNNGGIYRSVVPAPWNESALSVR
ncbi:MAG: quinoprotein dehydrogenase-associated SoxYZ-like carrier [Hyphomicrobium sp.]